MSVTFLKSLLTHSECRNTRNGLLFILLLAATFTVFFPSIFFDFTNWDDDWMLVNNPLVKSLSLSNIRRIFTELYNKNYQPIVIFSYAVEHYFFGLNAKIFHLTNVMLHLINVSVVYIFIKSISDKGRIAFIASALFALHPLRVESVVWITERRDLLYTMFFLLALVQYVKYIKSAFKARHYLFSLSFFVLSCMCKGMAVSFAPVVVLLDFLFIRKYNRQFVIDKIPFFSIALIFGLIAIFATHGETQSVIYEQASILDRMVLACYAFLFYIYKLVLPFNLSAMYPYPDSYPESYPAYFFAYPVICLVLTAMVIYSVKFTRKIFFSFSFFFVTIVFVLQLIPTHISIAADHYSYISSVGLTYLVAEFFHYFFYSNNAKFHHFNKYASCFLLALTLSYAILTNRRTLVWENSMTLWTDAIEKYPTLSMPYNNRGIYKAEQRDYIEAILDYTKAIKLNKNHANAYYNRALAYYKSGNNKISLEDFNKAIELSPKDDEARYNRGLVKLDLNDITGAVNDFTRAIELNGNHIEAFNNRAVALNRVNKFNEALADLNIVINYEPENAFAYANRGLSNAGLMKHNEAIEDYSTAIKMMPNYAQMYVDRGDLHYNMQHTYKACSDWEMATKLGESSVEKKITQYCL
ncbi:MAG: hypothetical protein COA57_04205 [Flavobacteriales bacterium]|nr:MAG: hypothetical protein COA57_04205 [Flavobacteriales bacterium]